MWSDNETSLDLLGFDFLVDELVVALTEPRLLPLTIGVVGDWGSGKSSLLRMTQAELEKPETGTYVCVEFSPWRFEDYEDVKVALMTAVLDELAPLAGEGEQAAEVGRLRAAANGLTRVGRVFGRGTIRGIPIVAAGAAAAAGLPPELVPAVAAGASEVASLVPGPSEGGAAIPTLDDPVDLSTFRARFGELVKQLEIDALVVFVDDLDRCLPDTVVDTFEAVRLFLNAPKTAFAVALNRRVVEDAINRQYPGIAGPSDTIGHDYLEKMLQLTITVPPLSEFDAETFLNLLLCETGLESGEAVAMVQQEAARRRREGELSVAMNYGIASGVVSIPSDLQLMFAWVNATALILTKGLRGNPRLLKRFLNTMELRLRAAKRRNVDLKQPELAKLMILEELWLSYFERLFRWQLDADAGKPKQLADAEALARGEAGADTDDEEVSQWVAEPGIAEWLKMDPSLKGLDLRPYFTFSRDRISASPGARLATHLQALLARLQATSSPARSKAVDDAVELAEGELSLLWDAIDDIARRGPSSPVVLAALDLASRKTHLVPRLHATLSAIPPQAVPPLVAMQLVQRFPQMPDELSAVLTTWSSSSNAALASAVNSATQASTRGQAR